MSNPTKILKTDLGSDLQELIDELKTIQGDAATLSKKLLNIDTSMMSEEEASVIEDLKEAFTTSNKPISQRLSELETKLTSFNLDQLETGNFNEIFTYENNEIATHKVTGDRNFEVTYIYSDIVNDKGKTEKQLSESIKSFTQANGNMVEIKKTYTYTNGDITGISTTTTITPAEVTA